MILELHFLQSTNVGLTLAEYYRDLPVIYFLITCIIFFVWKQQSSWLHYLTFSKMDKQASSHIASFNL